MDVQESLNQGIKDFSGHPYFLEMTLKELKLHSEKNKDYTKGGDSLGNFKRVSKILSNYPKLKLSDSRVVAIVYLLKQLDAVLWMISNEYEGKVENIDSRMQDVHIYAKIIRILNKEMKRVND